MKGWVKLAIKKMKEAYNCEHTVGMYYDHLYTELVDVGSLTPNKKDRHILHYVGDVEYFNYCPDCGEKLPYKERYKDAT